MKRKSVPISNQHLRRMGRLADRTHKINRPKISRGGFQL